MYTLPFSTKNAVFSVEVEQFFLPSSGLLLRQAVFGLDPVKFLQHRLRAQPEEEKRGNGADEIDRKAGNVIAKNNFPVDRVRPHERRRGIHNAAVDDRGRDHAEEYRFS